MRYRILRDTSFAYPVASIYVPDNLLSHRMANISEIIIHIFTEKGFYNFSDTHIHPVYIPLLMNMNVLAKYVR